MSERGSRAKPQEDCEEEITAVKKEMEEKKLRKEHYFFGAELKHER